MKDILSKLEPFYDSFTETDLCFLRDINIYSAKIKQELPKSITRREKIINYINNKKSNDSQEFFLVIENVINDLNVLIDTLENIERNVLELALKSEASYISSDISNACIDNIKIGIINFNVLYDKIYDSNNSDLIIIENFFNEIYEKDNQISDKLKNTNSENDNNVQIEDNPILRISEKDNKVYLPYSKSEILDFLHSYPNIYKDCKHVIDREYIADLTFYNRHPVISRFRETYSLMRDREMKPMLDAFKRSVDLMFKYELNPAIIAGLKSESQLDLYLECIEKNDLDNFKPFEIIFEVNPI